MNHLRLICAALILSSLSVVVYAFGEENAEEGRLIRRFQGHQAQVTSVNFGSSDDVFVSSSRDRRVILWKVTGDDVVTTSLTLEEEVYGAAVAADNKTVAIAPESLSAYYWIAGTGDPKRLNAHGDPLVCTAFAPKGTLWATGGKDGNIFLWNGNRKDPIGKLKGHEEAVLGIAFSADGSRLVSASGDKKAAIWDVRTKKHLRVLEGHKNVVRCAAFGPDGNRVATGSYDNTAIVWDAKTGKSLRTLRGHDKGVFGIAFSRDGKRLFTGGGGDRSIFIWDLESGEKLETLTGQPGAITSLSISPDGSKLLSSGGNEILLWDVSEQAGNE